MIQGGIRVSRENYALYQGELRHFVANKNEKTYCYINKKYYLCNRKEFVSEPRIATKPKKSKKYITIQQNTTVNSIELEKSCTFATVL
jgi:hypothetical protein